MRSLNLLSSIAVHLTRHVTQQLTTRICIGCRTSHGLVSPGIIGIVSKTQVGPSM